VAENNSDTPVEAGEQKPEESGKPTVVFWKSQLDAYDNAAKDWKGDVDSAFDEYLNTANRGKEQKKSNSAHFPLFWACVRTIQPAFYSRTPVIVTEKSFKEMRDPIARLAAVMAERLGKYAVRTSAFDRSMQIAVTHFIMAEKSSLRVIFDSAITETQSVNEMGQPVTDQSIDYLNCDTEPMSYKDYRHTPNARHQGEIDWISFDTLLSRSEAEDVFGEQAQHLTYGPAGNAKDKDRTKEIKGLPTHYATITEIWDKKKRQVYYLSPGYNEWLSHKNNPTGKDPYKLKDFFPCAPFIMGTQGAEDMFTAPAYIQLRDFIDQIHGAFDRVRRLLLALKKVGIFDSAKSELAELNGLTSEGQFIGIADLETLLGPGGTLDNLIHFFPTDKIATGVNELKTAIMEFEQKVYDLWGIPDIYRGISDPNETLGAQQLKGKHMSVRFSWLQREVQRLCRDTIEIMVDLYLAKCPDFKLAQIMGFQFMTEEEKQVFPLALDLLKNDTERCIRLEIETDSTITQNMNADIEQKNYMAKTLFDGLGSMKDLDPAFMPVAAKAVELTVQSLQQGKQIEQELGAALEQLAESAKNPAPPPPDPAMLKAQAEIQAAQQKAQIDSQLMQQKMQTDMQIEQQRAQAAIAVEERQTMADIAREDRKAQAKIASDTAIAQTKMQLAQFQAEVTSASESQKAQIKEQADLHKAMLDRDAAEHQAKLDMIAASFEAKLDRITSANQEIEKEVGKSKDGKQAPIHINIEAAKPKKFTIKRDGQNSIIEPGE